MTLHEKQWLVIIGLATMVTGLVVAVAALSVVVFKTSKVKTSVAVTTNVVAVQAVDTNKVTTPVAPTTNVAEDVISPVVTNTVTITNWVEVVIPVENYVFSWSLPAGKKINGQSNSEPVQVRITDIGQTNISFYVIFDGKEGKKDVCYYQLISADGVKWSGVWEQTSPYFSGTCYADKANGVWIGQFATPTESPMFKLEKRE